jgi:hypothetical protein
MSARGSELASQKAVEGIARDKYQPADFDSRNFPPFGGFVCAVSADAKLFGSLRYSERDSLGLIISGHCNRPFCETKSHHKIVEDYLLSIFMT